MIIEIIAAMDTDNINLPETVKKQMMANAVVRCRDCRWWSSGSNEVDGWDLCMRDFGKSFSIGADGYCSRGERIEDD